MVETSDVASIDSDSSLPTIVDRSDRRADSNSETRDRRIETVFEMVETSDVASIDSDSSLPTIVDRSDRRADSNSETRER
jgi:hypothetical protein